MAGQYILIRGVRYRVVERFQPERGGKPYLSLVCHRRRRIQIHRLLSPERRAEILRGVKAAQPDVERAGGCINPAGVKMEGVPPGSVYDPYAQTFVVMVDMEVGVEVVEQAGKRGSLSVTSAWVSVGTQSDAAVTGKAASRIRFTIPLRLPRGEDPHPSPFAGILDGPGPVFGEG